ncbi:class I SAM-dependent methyltransferase [Olivibacter sitiensis]|uniref:class I SAM-dependent methyltransferase n=1 Tax=Olivibacter sitiensis TaxID=376470 RepID=UPI0003F5485A|nr:class I SAM-dependent methyltransferase [Olivibacter sitiensis]
MKNTERFSLRADKYDKFRPAYPVEMMDFLRQELGVTPNMTVAEIGAGTGIFTEQLAQWGCTIYAVEPNVEMRHKAGAHLEALANCHLMNGEAERTGLPDHAIDLIVCAQAFHWFDFDKTRIEFERIIRQGGAVAIIWNMRSNMSAFEREYEKVLEAFSTDLTAFNERNQRGENLASFFGNDQIVKKIYNYETFIDYTQLLGRTYSYSYMPNEEKDNGGLKKELKKLFDNHEENGRVRLSYKTLLFLGRF